MRPENEEHGLRVQLATALRERDIEREFRGAAEAAFAEQLARTEAAESALAAAQRECEVLRAALAKCGNISVPHSQMRPEKP